MNMLMSWENKVGISEKNTKILYKTLLAVLSKKYLKNNTPAH